MLTLDADTAVLLAVDATRGMLDACLRRDDARSSRQVEVAAASVAAPASSPAAAQVDSASEHEACPAWRATQAKRAYLSTLPPPASEPALPRGCDRWAWARPITIRPLASATGARPARESRAA